MIGARQIRSAFASALLVAALAVPGVDASALEPGEPAPQFSLPSLTGGESLSLGSRRGKVVYIDFWASWCGPCLVSLPKLEQLRAEFAGREFEILAINLDRDLDRARKFLRTHAIGYESGSDPHGRLPESFGLDTMPTSYLIDRQGKIRYRSLRGKALEKAVEELVKEQA